MTSVMSFLNPSEGTGLSATQSGIAYKMFVSYQSESRTYDGINVPLFSLEFYQNAASQMGTAYQTYETNAQTVMNLETSTDEQIVAAKAALSTYTSRSPQLKTSTSKAITTTRWPIVLWLS